MERDDFSSQDLCDIASAAPVDTLEETIEGKIQKQIAQLQKEFYEYVHSCVSRVDCYVTGAMTKYELSQKQAHAFVWECLDKSFAQKRAELNQAIEALHGLGEYRQAELREWSSNQETTESQ